jgi:hypothetical protein
MSSSSAKKLRIYVSRINVECEEAGGHKSTVVEFLLDNQTCERIN